MYLGVMFGEVVNECYLLDFLYIRDYIEFIDFFFFEDLEVFLVDMEFDYGSMLI